MDSCTREKVMSYHELSKEAKMVSLILRRLVIEAVVSTTHAIKRAIDVIGATIGLIAFSPIMAMAAIAIKIEDGGPLFYEQTRVGKWGKEFKIIKFRSMRVDADKMKDKLLAQNETKGLTFKMKVDPRITKVGKWIRKLSVDEMPQFVNVLRGEMTLVGPRPPVPREVALYGPHERRRLEVTPGITCIWQVSGRSDIPFDGQVLLDIRYIRERTIWTDIVLLFKTIPAVLLGKGAY